MKLKDKIENMSYNAARVLWSAMIIYIILMLAFGIIGFFIPIVGGIGVIMLGLAYFVFIIGIIGLLIYFLIDMWTD